MKEKIIYLLLILPRVVKYKFLSTHSISIGKRFNQYPCLFLGKGKISIAKDCQIGVQQSPDFYNTYSYFEARNVGSSIKIGEHVAINNHCRIIADKSNITLGNHVLVGVGCTIVDSDFHHIHPKKRHSNLHESKAVIIEDDVFLGNDVTILKGVTIGRNSIIGAGSIVSKSIPPNVIAAGNPCQVVKKINEENL